MKQVWGDGAEYSEGLENPPATKELRDGTISWVKLSYMLRFIFQRFVVALFLCDGEVSLIIIFFQTPQRVRTCRPLTRLQCS